MANAFNIDQIVQEFGAFYQKGSQGYNSLFRGLMQIPVTLKLAGINHIKTNDTIYRGANPIVGSFLQPYQEDFTPKGSVDFHPNEIQLRPCKVDVEIFPERIEESWLGFLGGDDSRTLQNWPITKYIIKQILDSVNQDKELQVVYKGQYSAPVVGTAGESYQCFDGLHKQLLAAVADAQYPAHLIEGVGELTAADCFDQVEFFVRHIPEKYRRLGLPIFMSDDMRLAYLETKRLRGYYTVKDDTELTTRIDFSNCRIVALPSMAETTDIFTTLPSNIVHLTKRDHGATNFDVQKDIRKVILICDWFEALGFVCNDYIFTNRSTAAGAVVADPVIDTATKNKVSMSTATASADIYYTTDGSEPTTDSTKYTSQLTLTSTQTDVTFKARAFKTGLAPSAIVTKAAGYEA